MRCDDRSKLQSRDYISRARRLAESRLRDGCSLPGGADVCQGAGEVFFTRCKKTAARQRRFEGVAGTPCSLGGGMSVGWVLVPDTSRTKKRWVRQWERDATSEDGGGPRMVRSGRLCRSEIKAGLMRGCFSKQWAWSKDHKKAISGMPGQVGYAGGFHARAHARPGSVATGNRRARASLDVEGGRGGAGETGPGTDHR